MPHVVLGLRLVAVGFPRPQIHAEPASAPDTSLPLGSTQRTVNASQRHLNPQGHAFVPSLGCSLGWEVGGGQCRTASRALSPSLELLPTEGTLPHPPCSRASGTFHRRHEWEKHGTCAAQLDALSSEKKYFGKSLDLYKTLGLNSMMQKLGIRPSTNYYQVADIKDALASIYGVVPKVQCLLPKQGEDVQTLGQIELCFTKELVLRNCTEPGPQGSWGARGTGGTQGLEVCEDGPVFYPPPPGSHP
ncbi:ribonuclease T2 [Erinaceus europaeus]|uniref:Ribonuclease T2 n=1 Tax=Erinaceus europaeus TaxID=9365 RepID=A0ABM3YJ58_ERIEU|nr:ribonuclease T2 [Erinaceus europaeus]